TPYTVLPDTAGDQSVLHSCMQSSGEYADPGVRIQQWVQAFGTHGLDETICADTFAPAMQQTAGELVKLLGPACLPRTLVESPYPSCQVVDSYVDAQNHVVSTPLQACTANGNTPPCWNLVADATICPNGLLPTIQRDPTMQLTNGLSTTFSCAECV